MMVVKLPLELVELVARYCENPQPLLVALGYSNFTTSAWGSPSSVQECRYRQRYLYANIRPEDLVHACEIGDLELTKMAKGLLDDISESDYLDSIQKAIINKHPAVVSYLYKSVEYRSALYLHIYTYGCLVDMFNLAIEAGFEMFRCMASIVNLKVLERDIYLMIATACLHKHLDIAKYLISEAVTPPSMDMMKQMLTKAATGGCFATIKLIFEKYEELAVFSLTMGYPHTILQICIKGRLDILRYVHSKQSIEDIQKTMFSMFVSAVGSGHLHIIKYLCNEFKIPREFIRIYGMILTKAASCGRFAIIKYLHERYTYERQDALRGDEAFPLSHAAANGHLATVMYLCEELGLTGHEIRKCNNKTLKVACQRGHLGVVQYLHERYNMRYEDTYGVLNGDLELVKYLCEEIPLTEENIFHGVYSPLKKYNKRHFKVIKYLIERYKLAED